MAEQFEPGQRVRLPHGLDTWVTIDFARPGPSGDWILYVARDGDDALRKVIVSAEDATRVEVLTPDGGGWSAAALAGMWTFWMAAAATDTSVSALSPSSLRPYAHQVSAVYGAMLPQPWLRFLLADEPGTGKTVMAGLYMREMRRLGLVRRALVVVPAGLVSKWQADFDRFFGGGLRRVTVGTVRERALSLDHDLWIVSLELAAVNAAVQEAIRPDRAGWDLVIFDEAHRLTPTAQSYHRVGRVLAGGSPRVLLMTATPHRGSEWLFRHLLHLVDPEVYPDPGGDPRQPLTSLRPGSIASAMARSARARWPGVVDDHRTKALRAALTARLTSSWEDSGASAITSPVEGLITPSRAPSAGSTKVLSIKLRRTAGGVAIIPMNLLAWSGSQAGVAGTGTGSLSRRHVEGGIAVKEADGLQPE